MQSHYSSHFATSCVSQRYGFSSGCKDTQNGFLIQIPTCRCCRWYCSSWTARLSMTEQDDNKEGKNEMNSIEPEEAQDDVIKTDDDTNKSNTSESAGRKRRLPSSNSNGTPLNVSPPKKQHYPTSAAAATLQCSVCLTGAPNYKCPKCRAIYCSIACCRKHKLEACSSSTPTTEPALLSSQSEISLPIVKQSKYLSSSDLDPTCSTKNSNRSNSSNDKPSVGHSNERSNRRGGGGEYGDLPVGWAVTDAMKRLMQESDWLRDELQDVGLRQLLSTITSTPNRLVAHNNRTNNRSHRGRLGANAPNNLKDDATTEREQVLETLKGRYPLFQQFLDKLLVLTGVLLVQENDTKDSSSPSAPPPPMDDWLRRHDITLYHLLLNPLPRRERPTTANSTTTTKPPTDSIIPEQEDASSELSSE